MYGFKTEEVAEFAADDMRRMHPDHRFLVMPHEWSINNRPVTWGVQRFRPDPFYKGGEAGDGFIFDGFVWFPTPQEAEQNRTHAWGAEYDPNEWRGLLDSRVGAKGYRYRDVAARLMQIARELRSFGEPIYADDCERFASTLRREVQ